MFTDVIIMAGGVGERLWPASSVEMPKQFMAIDGKISFLQQSIQRALALNITGKIVIVTRKDIEEQCTKQCNELALIENTENKNKIINDTIVLAEPCGRHTSAAIMSGLILLNKITNSHKHTVLVMTSDHVINPISSFVKDCNTAYKAAKDGKIVCFAIPPTEPSVAYGYIKTGKDIYNNDSTFIIDNFKEKPDLETAEKYLKIGNYWWNSGMFAFESEFFLEEMENCTPEVHNSFEKMINGVSPDMKKLNNISVINRWNEFNKVYETVPKIAVDKAIAEKTSKAVAVKSNFNWIDVGNWDTFSELCKNPDNKEVVEIESENNFVYSDLPVALCGVKDLAVVVKNGKVLVMKKGQSALVGEISKDLK